MIGRAGDKVGKQFKTVRNGRLPFTLDRTGVDNLSDQLVSRIVAAIDDGVYAEGDRLPTWDEMAEELGVSLRVPREAMRRLVSDGYVVARPRLGCVVSRQSKRKRDWKGIVLFVTTELDEVSYAQVAFMRSFRVGLARLGYQVLVASLRETRRDVFDFSAVTSALKFKVDLAVVASNKARVVRRFSEYGIPFFALGRVSDYPHCLGSLSVPDSQDAVDRMVEHCIRASVRRILQVGFCSPPFLDAAGAFERAGMTVERWTILPQTSGSRMESIRQAACAAFLSRFASSDRRLPDLILFTDDYVASGGLYALAALGVQAPRDVCIVTLANEGNVPLSAKGLACVLNRPAEAGAQAARRVGSHLAGRRVPDPAAKTCVYRPGPTFPKS